MACGGVSDIAPAERCEHLSQLSLAPIRRERSPRGRRTRPANRAGSRALSSRRAGAASGGRSDQDAKPPSCFGRPGSSGSRTAAAVPHRDPWPPPRTPSRGRALQAHGSGPRVLGSQARRGRVQRASPAATPQSQYRASATATSSATGDTADRASTGPAEAESQLESTSRRRVGSGQCDSSSDSNRRERAGPRLERDARTWHPGTLLLPTAGSQLQVQAAVDRGTSRSPGSNDWAGRPVASASCGRRRAPCSPRGDGCLAPCRPMPEGCLLRARPDNPNAGCRAVGSTAIGQFRSDPASPSQWGGAILGRHNAAWLKRGTPSARPISSRTPSFPAGRSEGQA